MFITLPTLKSVFSMKVAALFQIYLPYFLPRTPEWSEARNFQFQFDVEGHLVNIHPRRAPALIRSQGADRFTCMGSIASPTVYQKTSVGPGF